MSILEQQRVKMAAAGLVCQIPALKLGRHFFHPAATEGKHVT